jgi:predicted TPR repeat methyltransferase
LQILFSKILRNRIISKIRFYNVFLSLNLSFTLNLYSKKTLEVANSFAAGYEQYVLTRNWSGPEILYNEIINSLKPGDSLLDIGIGTGLASKPFKQAGIHITGLDGSLAMLEICKQKNIAEELKCIDIASEQPDFDTQKFNAIISCAVFHMIENLIPIFENCQQLLLMKGIFAFTVISYNSETDDDFNETATKGIYERVNEESGIINFRHSREYINNISLKTGFSSIKSFDFMGFKDKELNQEVVFTLYILIN